MDKKMTNAGQFPQKTVIGIHWVFSEKIATDLKWRLDEAILHTIERFNQTSDIFTIRPGLTHEKTIMLNFTNGRFVNSRQTYLAHVVNAAGLVLAPLLGFFICFLFPIAFMYFPVNRVYTSVSSPTKGKKGRLSLWTWSLFANKTEQENKLVANFSDKLRQEFLSLEHLFLSQQNENQIHIIS